MTVLDSDQMDIAVATVAVHAFAAANLESMMPRGESEHTSDTSNSRPCPVSSDHRRCRGQLAPLLRGGGRVRFDRSDGDGCV